MITAPNIVNDGSGDDDADEDNSDTTIVAGDEK